MLTLVDVILISLLSTKLKTLNVWNAVKMLQNAVCVLNTDDTMRNDGPSILFLDSLSVLYQDIVLYSYSFCDSKFASFISRTLFMQFLKLLIP